MSMFCEWCAGSGLEEGTPGTSTRINTRAAERLAKRIEYLRARVAVAA
ncbi:hypothetical protein [Streptomyces sp. SID1034]|nr:hypothetical protein [Streptomyces sp. SID1034]MYV93350.1 hypothetical protein [Streptomyces sp. SID1034]